MLRVLCFFVLLCVCSTVRAETFQLSVPNQNQVWTGPDFWANRLHDWRTHEGRIECIADRGRLKNRTLSLLTADIPAAEAGTLKIRVRCGLLNQQVQQVSPQSVAGVVLGVGREMDYRSRALVHGANGNGAGYLIGLTADGKLAFRDLAKPGQGTSAQVPAGALPRGNWQIASVDSDEGGNSSRSVLDGNPQTIWHTEWIKKKAPYPHEIVIDMGAVQTVDGIALLPRQGQSAGRIKGYEFYLSESTEQWGEPVVTGEFENNESLQRIQVKRSRARYIRLVATSAFNDRPSSTVAEIYALDSDREDDQPATTAQMALGPLTDSVMQIELKRMTDSEAVFEIDLQQGDNHTQTELRIPKERVAGGIALLSHPGDGQQLGQHWFQEFSIEGDLVKLHPERSLGPVVSSMYTVDENVLKLTAQFLPINTDQDGQASLEVQNGNEWQLVATTDIVVPGWTATFRVPNWDDTQASPYRITYHGQTRFSGTITKNPVEKDELVVAGFTGNHMVGHGFERDGYDFATNVWFPHQDVVDAVIYHDPDVLFFSGDQVYEGGSPTFADADPDNIKLDYLYKWYLWCWAYREVMSDRPTICEPDDHDVYQGNIWGQGGRKVVSPPGDRYNNGVARDHDGGYAHPADFVKMVERTQTSHLPDPYMKQKLEQGIGAYFTDWKWGDIGIAILEDRKFKSGCNRPDMPHSGTGRPDHFNDPEFDIAKLDRPGLTLLGEKQLEFLNKFAADWEGQVMKMAVSQTIFANMATHHGGGLQRLIADLDSNGWPQTGRNKAVDALRRGHIFHLGGDQHLATIVHHGIDEHGDAMWSFCVPSVANFYPRAWAPKLDGAYEYPAVDDYTGQHRDGFNHPVIVHAATNPGKDMGHEPAKLHNGMPGYGIVRLNKKSREITMECWPRFSDPQDPDAKQYVGWPKTIHQLDNYQRKPFGYLGELEVVGAENFVVKVKNQATGEIAWSVRSNGSKIKVPVFEDGKFTLITIVDDHSVKLRETPNETLTVPDLIPRKQAKPLRWNRSGAFPE